MSVTFLVDAGTVRKIKIEPCLCAQMAPAWGSLFRGESNDFVPLRGHADPSCDRCGGTGAEPVEQDDRPQVNFANDNARLVLQALGFDAEELIGCADLPTLRRGFIRVRNVRQPETLRAAEVGRRFVCPAYERADLLRAVERLEALVRDAERLGVRFIVWS